MSYAIIGSGKVGQALATAFARKGLEVAIASRRSAEALAPIAKAIGPTISPKSLKDAVQADIVLLAVPFGTQKDIAKAAERWQGQGPPEVLIEEMGDHLRAILRDVLCGHLDTDVRAVADELLAEAAAQFA